MAVVSIPEAARRLGVSQDTIRRRIRGGQLQAGQKPTPQGFRWAVDLGEAAQAEPPPSHGQDIGGAREGEGLAFRELVATLQAQVEAQRGDLEARRREVLELHALLGHLQQRALPASGGISWWRRLWPRR